MSETWTGEHVLFYRDLLAVLHKLMSNTLFKDNMKFKAEKHYTADGTQKYSEIHWSDFWWQTQVK